MLQGITLKQATDVEIERLWRLLLIDVRDRIQAYEVLHLDPTIRPHLALETLRQLLERQKKRNLLRLAPSKAGHTRSLAIMLPMRSTIQLRKLWPKVASERTRMLAAFLEGFPMAERPFIDLIGTVEVFSRDLTRFSTSISRHIQVESLYDLYNLMHQWR